MKAALPIALLLLLMSCAGKRTLTPDQMAEREALRQCGPIVVLLPPAEPTLATPRSLRDWGREQADARALERRGRVDCLAKLQRLNEFVDRYLMPTPTQREK